MDLPFKLALDLMHVSTTVIDDQCTFSRWQTVDEMLAFEQLLSE